MKRIVKSLTLISAAAILFPSCASIFSKSNYPLTINSNPSDAYVTITNSRGVEYAQGYTPLLVTLKASDGFFSKAHYNVKYSKEGYEDIYVPVTFSIDGWYFGNILLGGFIGMLIVDPATGAMWRIDQDVINANLREKQTAQLQVLDISEISDEMKDKLIAIEK